MECKRALLADYVFETRDGKLSAVGLFDRIIASSFPAKAPAMGLALQLQFHGGEHPQHTIQVRLVNQDGHQLIPEFRFDLVVHNPERDSVHTLTLNLQGISLPEEGRYRFDVIIDGRFAESVPFDAVRHKQNAG